MARSCAYRPRLVLGFGEKTPMASPDHWQAMQITDAAIFYSRLTKWDEYFDRLPVHTVSTHCITRWLCIARTAAGGRAPGGRHRRNAGNQAGGSVVTDAISAG